VQYKAIEYQVVRTANPTGWKWTVQLGATRTRTGASYSMKSAVLDAQRKIDKELKTDKKLMSVKAKQSPLFRPVSVTRTDALHGGLAMSRKSALSLRMDKSDPPRSPFAPLMPCPACANEMRLLGIESETAARDLYTFECAKCGRLEVRGVTTV
jgi:hypothetical protein